MTGFDELAAGTDPTPLKVLFYDIETAPLLAYIWHPTDQYVVHDRLIHGSFMLTWAAKWRGQAKITSGVLTPEEALAQDDSRIVAGLADMVRQADIIVAHNGDRFDVPVLNARLLQLTQTPIGSKQTIDTCKLAKRNFRLAYNKLDYLGEYLGLGRKIKTEWELWEKCYHGDPKALREMARYNRQDVTLLESIFERLLPYVKGIPRLVEATDVNQGRCPACGSANLIRDGVHRTNASTFPRMMCQSCGRQSRSRKSNNIRLGLLPV